MTTSARDLRHCQVHAADGPIGKLEDILFDDEAWVVRHLVVTVGSWLAGRPVLISPLALQLADSTSRTIRLRLTRAEVRASPDLATDPPVTRWQPATSVALWPSPWSDMSVWSPGTWPVMPDLGPAAQARSADQRASHLCSVRDVTGYRIRTADRELGRLRDFLFEDKTLAIAGLVVQFKRGHSHQTLAIAPEQVTSVDWERRTVTVDLHPAKPRNPPTEVSSLAGAHPL
jgi:sporulation protein YlmC with PRC-barrel domain